MTAWFLLMAAYVLACCLADLLTAGLERRVERRRVVERASWGARAVDE